MVIAWNNATLFGERPDGSNAARFPEKGGEGRTSAENGGVAQSSAMGFGQENGIKERQGGVFERSQRASNASSVCCGAIAEAGQGCQLPLARGELAEPDTFSAQAFWQHGLGDEPRLR